MNYSLNATLDQLAGPAIAGLLQRDDIMEIYVNDDGHLRYKSLTEGKRKTNEFLDPDKVRAIIELITGQARKVVNSDIPSISTEIAGYGCRFQGELPPIVRNPQFNIRKKATKIFTFEDYVSDGALDPFYRDYLEKAIKARKNILVVGGTGTGKTTFLNAVLEAIARISPDHRIISLEDLPELQCPADDYSPMFTMQDTGVGMDPDYLPKMFDTFSQEDVSNTNKYGGSGLGMAITKNLVEMMGGEIQVESKKNVGSKFIVTVPLTMRKVDDIEKQSAAAEEPISEADITDILSGKRVLIAEDVDQNAEILADILELEEVISARARNGEEAVQMFSKSEKGFYSAILMDVRMPVMDGLDATKTIRALVHPDAKTIPIIAMTANVFDEDVERSLEAGMDAHLFKPVEPDVLYETMTRLIVERTSKEVD